MLVAPSMSPWRPPSDSSNPGLRLYKYDTESGQVCNWAGRNLQRENTTRPPHRQYHFYCVRLHLDYGYGKKLRVWQEIGPLLVADTLLCVRALFSQRRKVCNRISFTAPKMRWQSPISFAPALGDCKVCIRSSTWRDERRLLHRRGCILKLIAFARETECSYYIIVWERGQSAL
jgi:hypothetical protein